MAFTKEEFLKMGGLLSPAVSQPQESAAAGGLTPEQFAKMGGQTGYQLPPRKVTPSLGGSVVNALGSFGQAGADLATDIAKPFARVGVTAYNALSAIPAAVRGDVAATQEAINKPRNLSTLGVVKPVNTQGSFGEYVKDAGGVAAEIASTLAAPGGVAASATRGAGVKGFVKAVTPAIKEGFVLGAGASGGREAQEEGSTAGSITSAGLGGGLTGAAFNTGITGASQFGSKPNVLSKSFNKPKSFSTSNTRAAVREIENATQYNSRTKFKRQENEKIASFKAQGKTTPKTAPEVMAESGTDFFPDTKELPAGGTAFDSEQQIVRSNERIKQGSEEMAKALDELAPEQKHDLLELKDRIVKGIKSNHAADEIAAQTKLADAIDAEIQKYGRSTVTSGELVRIKQGLYDKGYSLAGDLKETSNASAFRHAGSVLKKEIETINARTNPDLPIEEMNQRISELINMRRYLKALDGTMVRGSGIMAKAAGLTGALVGRSSGVPIIGDLVGYKIGEGLQRWAVDPARRFAKAEKLRGGAASAFDVTSGKVRSAVDKEMNARKTRLALPAPAPKLPPKPDTSGTVFGRKPQVLPTEPRPNQLRLPAKATPEPIEVLRPGIAEGRAKIAPTAFKPRQTNEPSYATDAFNKRQRDLELAKKQDNSARAIEDREALQRLAMEGENGENVTKYQSQIEAKQTHELNTEARMFADEKESGYQAFKAAAKRNKEILSMDADQLRKKYPGYGVVENKFFTAADNGNETESSLLEAFRKRFKQEEVKPRFDNKFIKKYESADKKLSVFGKPSGKTLITSTDLTENPPLYHGTSENGVAKFDNSQMRGGNQGNGVYLTDSSKVADYHSYDAQSRLEDAKNGKMTPYSQQKPGKVEKVFIKPNIKIKVLDKMPTKSEVDALKKEGFDGVRFPDEITREEWNTKRHGDYPSKNEVKTTMIFDAKNVQTNHDFMDENYPY